MSHSNRPSLSTALVLALLALGLAGCATAIRRLVQQPQPPPRPRPCRCCRRPSRRRISSGAGALPPTTRTRTVPRIEAAAADQCKQPYVITLGPTGGVMMHLADQATPDRTAPERRARRQDLYRPGGRPAGQRAGSRGGVLRWPRADPALDGFGSAGPLRHHGLCALRAGRRQTPGQAEGKPKPKPKPKAEPKPIQPPIQSAPPPPRSDLGALPLIGIMMPRHAAVQGHVARMPALRDFIDGPWRAVPVLGVTQILSWGTIFYTPVLIVPLIAAERGWSMSFAMGGFSVGLLAAGLSAPYVGRSIDRFGGHVVMTDRLADRRARAGAHRACRRPRQPISRSGWCSASPWRRTFTIPPSPRLAASSAPLRARRSPR